MRVRTIVLAGARRRLRRRVVASPARRRPRRTARRRVKEPEGKCIELPRGGQQTVDDCQKAPNPILPATNEIIWGDHLLPRPARRCCGSSRCRRSDEDAWRPAPSGSAATSTRPRRPEGRGRGDPGRVPGAAGRRQERGRPHHRGGPPDGGRAQARPRAAAAGRAWPRCASRAEADVEAAKRRPRRPAERGRRRWPSVRRAGRRAQPRPRHPARSSSRATSTRWGRRTDGRPPTASTATPRRCSRSPAEGTSTRSRTSCSGSPASLEGNDELRDTLTDPAIPVDRRQADRRGPARRPGVRHDHGARVVRRRRRPGPRPAGDRRLLRRAERRASAKQAVAEVRSAVPLTEDQRTRLAARARPGHRQGRRGQGHRRPDRASAASSPRSATPSSTAGPCQLGQAPRDPD